MGPFIISLLGFHKRYPIRTANRNPNTGVHSIRSSIPVLADEISSITLHHEFIEPFSTQLMTFLLYGDSTLTRANQMFSISIQQQALTTFFSHRNVA